jgi:hypothetical protein
MLVMLERLIMWEARIREAWRTLWRNVGPHVTKETATKLKQQNRRLISQRLRFLMIRLMLRIVRFLHASDCS